MSPCLRERTECWVAMGVTAREGCLQLQPPSQGAKEGQRHTGMGGACCAVISKEAGEEAHLAERQAT